MPIAAPSNQWSIGIARQTNEATIATTSQYTFPVFSGRPQPVQGVERILVTDAAAIQGDPFKSGVEHWTADLVFPAYAAPLGRVFTTVWPTDTISGAGPYVHTYTGLGTTTAWHALYSDPYGGALDEIYEAGLATSLSLSADENGGPVRVGLGMVGKRPTVASWTVGGANTLQDGYFTAKGGTLKMEVDNATPATVTNIQSFSVNIARNAQPVSTADATSASLISQGILEPSFTMTTLYTDWDAYRATFYGATNGTVPSNTIVEGSLELNFVHTLQAGWALKVEIPSAVFVAQAPQPDPAGPPAVVQIDGYATTPGSGEHVEVTLTNSVATSYSA